MKTTKKELKEFINSSIITALFERKFNPREFSKVPFEEMVEFAKNNGLRYLGEGSSRVVFVLDSKRVIKIAINMKGIAQNRAELELSHDREAPIARVYQYDTDMWWLVSELVRPLTSPEEFKALTGIPWQVLKRFINGRYDPDDLETFRQDMIRKAQKNLFDDTSLQDVQNIDKNPAILKIAKFLTEKGSVLLPGDLMRIEHWGKTPDQRVVLLDYGYTDEVYSDYYQ
jgi:hypothetical protein